jgi:hypothetical protein
MSTIDLTRPQRSPSRDGEQADGQRDDAGERPELRVGECPFQLEEGEDRRQDLPGHVVREQESEGGSEDDPGEELPGLRGRGGRGLVDDVVADDPALSDQ